MNIELQNVRLAVLLKDESEPRMAKLLTMSETAYVHATLMGTSGYHKRMGMLEAFAEEVSENFDAWHRVPGSWHMTDDEFELAMLQADIPAMIVWDTVYTPAPWDDDAIDDATEREMREQEMGLWNKFAEMGAAGYHKRMGLYAHATKEYQESEGWPRWCEQCKRVKPFKTPEGKSAPFAHTDWTDDEGHTAK